ncbi:hypothetical protein BX600DRAFT_435822 [Xylariales sp. PMI_506]|nr:hypothetical protein BX600DRAFT_435822 [Xylariales sp. PMI_506]
MGATQLGRTRNRKFQNENGDFVLQSPRVGPGGFRPEKETSGGYGVTSQISKNPSIHVKGCPAWSVLLSPDRPLAQIHDVQVGQGEKDAGPVSSERGSDWGKREPSGLRLAAASPRFPGLPRIDSGPYLVWISDGGKSNSQQRDRRWLQLV